MEGPAHRLQCCTLPGRGAQAPSLDLRRPEGEAGEGSSVEVQAVQVRAPEPQLQAVPAVRGSQGRLGQGAEAGAGACTQPAAQGEASAEGRLDEGGRASP
eukprot:1795295-Alexandrium_andersonii.AAC.1